MTRRRVLCGLLLLSALLACLGGWLWIASPRVTRARLEQVRYGMSRDEVIHTVGGAPGDYSRGQVSINRHSIPSQHETWLCEDGLLFVRFDDADKATNVVIHDVVNSGPPTLTERIRRWLGL
jgi:hypothetical protein